MLFGLHHGALWYEEMKAVSAQVVSCYYVNYNSKKHA